ncbi:helix-turn-helix domain-containing protein [Flagellimonas myxillae]|uniref:helix-turn-helix domain-containing protein n=1 Tax=Flagellimonas myxillae TaxID=2942214 RepID=UPI00201F6F5E|nr:helix-turn-helix domain-containing protein [Muricauda myxillae]MCL6267192.1 helix-turn-helix domain-containing protein [Muricauda myxillae]
MNLSLNIFQLIFILGGVHGLISSGILFYKRNKSINTILFGLFLFSVSLACIKIPIQEIFPRFNSSFPIPILYQFTWGPLLYLLILSSLYHNFKLKNTDYLLFIPSLLFDVGLRFVTLWSGVDRGTLNSVNFLVDIIAALYFLFFLVRSLNVLSSFKKGLEDFYSDINRNTIFWISSFFKISFLLIVCWLVYIVSTIALSSYSFGSINTYYPAYIAISGIIYYLTYSWASELRIQQLESNSNNKPLNFPIYDAQEILDKVLENKYYLNPEITIKSLANLMQLNRNGLSHSINKGLDKNFNDFINELRVDEVKRILNNQTHTHLTLLGIGLESGFNSKASFNRAFKKFTGQTPSEYHKTLSKK